MKYNLKYYINNVVDKPWNNHLLLAIFVYTEKNLDVRTIEKYISTINPRLSDLFQYFNLTEMERSEY